MAKSLAGALLAGLVVVASLTAAAPAVADPIPDVVTASVSTSVPVVYPHKDGYRDTVSITASGATSDASVSTSPGTIVITKGAKVEKTWTISAAAPVTKTWSGRVKSKISTGTYTVTVTYTNADASTATDHTTVVVSSKKLVKHTWVKKGDAYPTMTSCVTCYYDSIVKTLPPTHKNGVTVFHNKIVNGIRYWGVQSTVDLSDGGAVHSVKLPAGFASSIKSSAYVSAHVTVSGAKGHRFYIEACGIVVSTSESGACTLPKSVSKTGTITSSKVTLLPGSTRASWLAGSSLAANVVVATYTVHVTYYTLK